MSFCLTYFINLKSVSYQKNRTSDHVLTLRTLVDKYVDGPREKIYACFADFKRAFDSVWHEELYSTANDPQLQMIPRPQMIPKMDRK